MPLMQAWRVFQEFIEKIKAENVTEVEGGVFFWGVSLEGFSPRYPELFGGSEILPNRKSRKI